MAIIRGKIYSRERHNLGEIVPLKAPFSIQIDVCSACNMKCNFCFHSSIDAVNKSGISLGLMDIKLFKKIIDDIKNCWGTQNNGDYLIKKLRLFKIGEPLLNPHLPEMIKYAKEANVAEIIEITTNGTLLNEDLNRKLIDAGIDIINISVNGNNSQQYNDYCDYKMDYNRFIDGIKNLYDNKGQCKIFIKFGDTGLTDDELNKFYRIFENFCDEIFVEKILPSLWQDVDIDNNGLSESKVGIYGQKMIQKKVCPFLFTTMVINTMGIVHLCCVDWKSEYYLGDLNNESITDIWNGKRLREYQKIHLRGRRENIAICKKCESLSASTIDNLDGYCSQVLSRINDSEL